MNSNFEALLIGRNEWDWEYENVYVKPNIPHKKLMNALSYAPGINPYEILILIDDTVFGGAKDGMLITCNAIYCHEIMTPMKKISLDKIKEIGMDRNSQVLVNGNDFFKANIVDHLTLLTLTARINTALKESQADAAEIDFPSAIKENKVIEQRKSISDNETHEFLNYISNDQYFDAIKKIDNLKKVSSVASFFLGDNSEKRPISKLVEESVKVIHKSVFNFRRIFIDQIGIIKLANNLSTVEVECYTASKIISQILKYSIPDTILESILESGITDALFIKTERDRDILFSIIKSYSQDDNSEFLFCARLFINNREKKLIKDIAPYTHHIVDLKSNEVTKQFSEFVLIIENSIEIFEKENNRLVKDYVDEILNSIHRR